MKRSLNLARNILVETLETMDQTIKNSAERLEAYVVEQNGQPKELLLPLGSIRFKRTCYTSKKTGKSVYLLDEVIGIEGHQRITMGAAAAILEETLESSYRKGGEHASLMDSVSKQTVKNLVHDTVIELPIQEQEEKKESGTCHIKRDIPPAAWHYRSSRSRLRLWWMRRCSYISSSLTKSRSFLIQFA